MHFIFRLFFIVQTMDITADLDFEFVPSTQVASQQKKKQKKGSGEEEEANSTYSTKVPITPTESHRKRERETTTTSSAVAPDTPPARSRRGGAPKQSPLAALWTTPSCENLLTATAVSPAAISTTALLTDNLRPRPTLSSTPPPTPSKAGVQQSSIDGGHHHTALSSASGELQSSRPSLFGGHDEIIIIAPGGRDLGKTRAGVLSRVVEERGGYLVPLPCFFHCALAAAQITPNPIQSGVVCDCRNHKKLTEKLQSVHRVLFVSGFDRVGDLFKGLAAAHADSVQLAEEDFLAVLESYVAKLDPTATSSSPLQTDDSSSRVRFISCGWISACSRSGTYLPPEGYALTVDRTGVARASATSPAPVLGGIHSATTYPARPSNDDGLSSATGPPLPTSASISGEQQQQQQQPASSGLLGAPGGISPFADAVYAATKARQHGSMVALATGSGVFVPEDQRRSESPSHGGFIPVFFPSSKRTDELTPPAKHSMVWKEEGKRREEDGYSPAAEATDDDAPMFKELDFSCADQPAPVVSPFLSDKQRSYAEYIDRAKPFACQKPPKASGLWSSPSTSPAAKKESPVGVKEEPTGDSLDQSNDTTSSSSGTQPPQLLEGSAFPLMDAPGTASGGGGSPNQMLISELSQLASVYEAQGDKWRQYAYNRAIGIIKRVTHPVESVDDLSNYRGLGDRILTKIDEILKTGKTRKLEYLRQSEQVQSAETFVKIWGVGPAVAKKIYNAGFTTIEDLRESPKKLELLSSAQLVGLKFMEDLQIRIPRDEVTLIQSKVAAALQSLVGQSKKVHVGMRDSVPTPPPGERLHELDLVTCGSYRRGKPTSGDVDVLICDRSGKLMDGLLTLLVDALRRNGFIVGHLTHGMRSRMEGSDDGVDTWFGVVQLADCDDPTNCPCTHRPNEERDDSTGMAEAFRGTDIKHFKTDAAEKSTAEDTFRTSFRCGRHLARRLDIKVYSAVHFPFAVLYFTGSDYFNRSMRLYCEKKGMSLSDKSLKYVVRVKREKVHEGSSVPCLTERDIFVATGLPYKLPNERDL